jgi:integrase
MHQVVGNCKTEASAKPVPMDSYMAEDLLRWRRQSDFASDDDYVFASETMKGKLPYWPDNLMKRHIRPVAKANGIDKNIGWHTFRHSFGTLLKANGEDVKTVQELLRHANSRITFEHEPNVMLHDRDSVDRLFAHCILAKNRPSNNIPPELYRAAASNQVWCITRIAAVSMQATITPTG